MWTFSRHKCAMTGESWRIKNTIVVIFVSMSVLCFYQPGRDAKGAALALFTARLHRPDVTTHKAVLQAIIYQLDKAIERFDVGLLTLRPHCSLLALFFSNGSETQGCLNSILLKITSQSRVKRKNVFVILFHQPSRSVHLSLVYKLNEMD